MATTNADVEIAKLLLSLGADVNADDYNGSTALMRTSF
jgi:ankyrin repeat protein